MGGALGVQHLDCTVRQVHVVCGLFVRPSPSLLLPGALLICRGWCVWCQGFSGRAVAAASGVTGRGPSGGRG